LSSGKAEQRTGSTSQDEVAHQVSAIENPMKIKETRKLIARLKTELTAKVATAQK